MRCSDCGYDAADDALFCESCGGSLKQSVAQQIYTAPLNEQPQNPYQQQSYSQQNPYGQRNPYQQNAYGQQNTYQQNAYGQQNTYQQNPYGQQNTYQQNPYGQQNTYQQNPYGQQQQQWAARQQSAQIAVYRSQASASMVMGILACVFWYTFVLGIIFSCIALSKSNRALPNLRRLNAPAGTAIAGRILGIIGLVASCLFLFVIIGSML